MVRTSFFQNSRFRPKNLGSLELEPFVFIASNAITPAQSNCKNDQWRGVLLRWIFILRASLQAVDGQGDESPHPNDRPKRILLLGQKPDSHPRATHEYMSGVRLIGRYLQQQGGLHVVLVQADDPWADGPDELDGADGVFLFLSEGAKWVSSDASRLAAFERLAGREGALSGLHWGLGTKTQEPVSAFVKLLGGCHGGPDRKYKVDTFRLSPLDVNHPITAGIKPFSVHDEFYYGLKFPPRATAGVGESNAVVPLIQVTGSGVDDPVAWAWERPDGGRSFGFTGLHFHENWKLLEYRRLVIQGILWSVKRPIPPGGLDLELKEGDLDLPDVGTK